MEDKRFAQSALYNLYWLCAMTLAVLLCNYAMPLEYIPVVQVWFVLENALSRVLAITIACVAVSASIVGMVYIVVVIYEISKTEVDPGDEGSVRSFYAWCNTPSHILMVCVLVVLTGLAVVALPSIFGIYGWWKWAFRASGYGLCMVAVISGVLMVAHSTIGRGRFRR